MWPPRIPGKALDDTQRVVIGALGGTLMVGAITWPGAEILIRVAMFFIGAALFIWAVRGGNRARAALDKAVADGNGVLQMAGGRFRDAELATWRENTLKHLRDDVGIDAVEGFGAASAGHKTLEGCVVAQVAYLRELRESR